MLANNGMLWFILAALLCYANADSEEKEQVNTVPYTDEKLDEVVKETWEKDPYRLYLNDELFLSWQGYAKGADDKTDNAVNPLCTIKSDKMILDPSFANFLSIFQKYNPLTGMQATPCTKCDIYAFMTSVFKSRHMTKMREFLVQNNLVSNDLNVFKKQVEDAWFESYFIDENKRKRSSGFQHVFLGEVSLTKAEGMHFWATFCLNERKGNLNYTGRAFSKVARKSNKGTVSYRMYKDSWNFGNTLLFGESIEFDFWLYTIAYFYLKNHHSNRDFWPPLKVKFDNTEHLIKCEQTNDGKIKTCHFMK